MKPHLRKVPQVSAVCYPWVCTSGYRIGRANDTLVWSMAPVGWGDTPDEAYEAWLRRCQERDCRQPLIPWPEAERARPTRSNVDLFRVLGWVCAACLFVLLVAGVSRAVRLML
jgi:hypothetical protein